MIEANLLPLQLSYQPHNMYCLHRSGEVCTQFQENSYILYLVTLGATHISHSSMRHVHNLMKRQLYAWP